MNMPRRHIPKQGCKKPTVIVERRKIGGGSTAVLEERPRLCVTGVTRDGSKDQNVGLKLNRNTSTAEQNRIEELIRAHHCYSIVHELRWRTRRTLVIEVRLNSLADLGQVDAENLMNQILQQLPSNLR